MADIRDSPNTGSHQHNSERSESTGIAYLPLPHQAYDWQFAI